MTRTSNDPVIRELLKMKPDSMYITPDGDKLYLLVPDEWETVLEFTGPDFSVMSDEDVEKYVMATFAQIHL